MVLYSILLIYMITRAKYVTGWLFHCFMQATIRNGLCMKINKLKEHMIKHEHSKHLISLLVAYLCCIKLTGIGQGNFDIDTHISFLPCIYVIRQL